MDQIGVLVVDDSALMRHIISSQLQTDSSIRVVGTARDGLDALEKIRKLKPDVVALDLDMPHTDGLTTLGRAMVECPVPIIMLTNSTIEGADGTIRALTMGAVDFIAKPSRPISADIHRRNDELVAKVKQAATARLDTINLRALSASMAKRKEEFAARSLTKVHKVVVIGSSTGGAIALRQVIPRLPKSLDAAVLVVQHMPPRFTQSLANHLNDISPLAVREAEHGDVLASGLVLVAPGDFHMNVKMNGRIELTKEPPVNNARPSVDVTMETLATNSGESCIAVVLTGAGSDGMQGARYIKAAGGYVIAEDASTCVVYGMSKHVIEADLADVVAPLPNIAEEIERAVAICPPCLQRANVV